MRRWTAAACALTALLAGREALATSEDTSGACQDGIDNDGDSYVDCLDQDCSYFTFCIPGATPAPPPPTPTAASLENTPETCQDGADNDADGHLDCDDQDCTFFAVCQIPPAGGGAWETSEPRPVEPAKRQLGGLGIEFVPAFVLAAKSHHQHEEPYGTEAYDETWKYVPFAPAFGVFGEVAPSRVFAIGFEGLFVFPDLEKISSEGITTKCTECKRDISFSGLLRIKVTIPAGRVAAPYPIFALGFNLYTVRQKDVDPVTHAGPAGGAGFGVEFHPSRYVTPFFDLRYLFTMAFNKKKSYDAQDWIMNHMLLISLGLRLGA